MHVCFGCVPVSVCVCGCVWCVRVGVRVHANAHVCTHWHGLWGCMCMCEFMCVHVDFCLSFSQRLISVPAVQGGKERGTVRGCAKRGLQNRREEAEKLGKECWVYPVWGPSLVPKPSVSKTVCPPGLSHGHTSLPSFFIFRGQAVGGWERGGELSLRRTGPSAGPSEVLSGRKAFLTPPGPGAQDCEAQQAVRPTVGWWGPSKGRKPPFRRGFTSALSIPGYKAGRKRLTCIVQDLFL